MASPTVTFPCPFCGRRMGVPAELVGKQVRCPHCKQVLLAPANAAPTPAAPPSAAPPAPAPVPVPIPQPIPAPIPAPMIQIASPPPAPAPQPVAPPPPPELPVFNIPQNKEGVDSIMGDPEESEDEVFGSHPGGRVRTLTPESPPEPPAPSAPAPAPVVSQTEIMAPTSAPSEATTQFTPTQLPESLAATTAIPNPFGELEPVSLPAVFLPPAPVPVPAPAPVAAPKPPPPAPQPIPAPAPIPQPAPVPFHPAAAAPQPAAPVPATNLANPFGDFDAPTAPDPAPRSDRDDDDDRPRKRKKRDRDDRDEKDDLDAKPEPKEKPARPGYSRAPEKSGGGGKGGIMLILLLLVSGYALLTTCLAGYGLLFKSGEKFDTGHPLSTIPDNFGGFDAATRGKVTLYKFPVDGELPTAQRGKLGEKIKVGDLEIEPKEIVKRPLVIETEGKSGEKRRDPGGTALVLKLDIKNMSDLKIYPMDPAFTRKAVGSDQPITRVVVDKSKNQVFAGGAISWPPTGQVKSKIESQQKNDSVPLAPGESREYVVFTDAKSDIIKAVENANGTIQWRVQVRRDPIQLGKKEVPVTAIIGVDFKAGDVRDWRENG